MTADGVGSETGGLSVTRKGAAAVVVLDRPGAKNALSIAMRAQLDTAFHALGRDPMVYAVVIRSAVPGVLSAGGDVREITALAAGDIGAARAALGKELTLCWLHECLSKPTVSLIDGAVMGTGVGITLYGTHRVGGERYRFAMPETAIGYFPDCGVLHAFARMPHRLGRYLALTGRSIGRADAYALGLLTHCIPAAEFAAIEAQLADADPVDPLLDDRHVDPGPSSLLADAARVDRYFSAATLSELMSGLGKASDADAEWAAGVLADLGRCSPTALAVTDEALRRAAHMDLRGALLQDFRLAWRFLELPDFREGVRARLIERSGQPIWTPSRIEDIGPEAVAAFLAELGDDELPLPTRAEMQASRV